jgi:hypothetical protein
MQTLRRHFLFVLGFVALAAGLILGTAAESGSQGPGAGGTLNVNVTNTPLPVDVANVPSVNVANVPGVNVANTPSVTVANTPSVNVNSLPAVSLAEGTTVTLDTSELVPTVGASAVYPIVLKGTASLGVGQSGGSTPVLYTVPAGWRLVIEHVSCAKASGMLADDYMICMVILNTPTFTGPVMVGSAGPFSAAVAPGVVAGPVKFFFDQNRPVEGRIARAASATGVGADYSITINGYLMPVS